MPKAISTILVLILSMCLATPQAFAQSKLSAVDKGIILTYIRTLNKAAKRDGDNTLHYLDGNVKYAPNSEFKIFSIKGEDCGAHCNCSYVSKLHSKSGKVYNIDLELPVDKIYKLNDGKYIILQQGLSCGGSVSDEYRAATLINFNGNKITYHPISYTDPVTGNVSKPDEVGNSFSLFQPYNNDETNRLKKLMLDFDTKSKRLNYRYLYDMNQCCGKDEAYYYSGYFEYIEGRFINRKEQRQRFTQSHL
jgi:hypothetical protein